MLSHFNLFQFNFIRNHNNVILDLALSNVHLCITNDPDPLVPIDKHHPALNISLNCNQFNILPVHIDNFNHDFVNCDYSNILKYIGDSLSTISYNECNVNDIVTQFYSILYDAIDLFVTRKRIYTNLFPIWFSATLKQFSKRKKKLRILLRKNTITSLIIYISPSVERNAKNLLNLITRII